MNTRSAYSFLELIVVILILGILAAIAVARFFGPSVIAEENTFRQSLAVVRDAIEFYTFHHAGALPAQDMQESTFKDELAPHLRSFPPNPFGNKANAERVTVSGDGTPLIDKVTGDGGWLYDCISGEFIADSLDVSSEGMAYSEY